MKNRTIATPIERNMEKVSAYPQKSLSMLSQSISVALPSNFVFYDFKDLYIKPFKIAHINKLMTGQFSNNIGMIAEVVDSVLATSTGETNLASKLTYEDFLWVLYWLRLNSFTKNKFKVTSKCKNPDHIAKVEKGELDKNTLKVTSLVEKSILECDYLPEDFKIDFKKYYPTEVELPEGFYLDIARYQDVIDMTDDPRIRMTVKDENGDEQIIPNSGYLLQSAAAVLMHWPNATWQQRYDFAGNLSENDYSRLMELGKTIPAYGIKEYVQVRCPRCGATWKVKTSVDARSFFLSA